MSSAKATPKTFVFRSWPKMVFLWPTTLMCLFMGLATQFAPDGQYYFGSIFVAVMGVNLLVLTFDFPRATSLTFATIIIAVGFGLLLLNQSFNIFPPIAHFFSGLKISASPHFYYMLFTIMLLLFGGMYFLTRFDYWELSSNELIHHQGMLGDVERFSTAGLKLNSELSDVFEYILWGAGRIIMTPPGTNRPIVLDNVPNIKGVTRAADLILEARTVRIDSSPTPTHDLPGSSAVTSAQEND